MTAGRSGAAVSAEALEAVARKPGRSLLVRLATAMNNAGTLATFALVFVICGDVIGRALLNRPIDGVP